ncbi:MAG: ATP-grasp domain-containing protein [Desulfovermiculus sp.]|nr:ATP-grasp domain-containing protein [Desulfovermiculus sp.]
MPNILITDGENRSALAATRSLGRKGCQVMVTGKAETTLASSSTHCTKGIAVPDPDTAGRDYAQAILDIARREEIDVILPMTEVSIYLLNSVRDRLPSGVVLACSPPEKMAAVSNKFDLFQKAQQLGVPVPATHYLQSPEDLPGVTQDIPRYPVVIKPSLSRLPQGKGFLSGGVKYAASREELEHIYATKEILQYPSMIQERIEGPGTGLFTLFDRDQHLALFSHRRIREKPPSGGVSVVSESAPLDEEMVEHACRLLSAVGWQGVAMVEFKRDNRDGQAKLMEINGRFWGTLQLAVSCGVDFPGLYLDLLLGTKPDGVVREYRVGHRMKWFLGTLDHLLIRLKNKDADLNLPSGYPSKWKAVVDFLHVWERNTSFDVLDRKDLRPFLFEARNYLKGT